MGLGTLTSMSAMPDLTTGQVRGRSDVRSMYRTAGEFSVWLYDEQSGDVRELNRAAAVVWSVLEEPTTFDDVCADLVDVLEMEPTQAAELTLAALEVLWDGRCIERYHDGVWAPIDGAGDSEVDEDPSAPASAAPPVDDGRPGDEASSRWDGPALLSREPDPCGTDLASLGWESTIDVVMGAWRVGIRPDTQRTRRRLVKLLEPHLAPGEQIARTNFSVRAPAGFGSRRPGSLYIAGVEVFASRSWSALVQALTHCLGGVERYVWGEVGAEFAPGRGTRSSAVLTARVVARDGLAVVVTTPANGRLGVGEVAHVGADDLALWEVELRAVPGDAPGETTGLVAPPDPPSGLGWEAAGVDPPTRSPEPLRLVGVVTGPADLDDSHLAGAWLSARRGFDEWGDVLSGLDARGRVLAASDSAEVIGHAATLLANP